MADFAPYQDIPPEHVRALSPPPSSTKSPSPRPQPRIAQRAPTPASTSSPSYQNDTDAGPGAWGSAGASSTLNDPASRYHTAPGTASWASSTAGGGDGYSDLEGGGGRGGDAGGYGVGTGGGMGGFFAPRSNIELYETSLRMRLDWEACLAYLALPPAGPALLLILEHRSDYVRFHAWQSALLFTFQFVVHVMFSWSSVLSWLILVVDLCLIAVLVRRAYQDAETLDRFQVPIFGALANSIVDDE